MPGVANGLGTYRLSLLIAILAIVSVFVEIPIVSDYAFWVMTGAFLLVVGIGYDRERRKKK